MVVLGGCAASHERGTPGKAHNLGGDELEHALESLYTQRRFTHHQSHFTNSGVTLQTVESLYKQ